MLGEHLVAALGFAQAWSAESAALDLADGTCDLHGWPDSIRIDLFASDAAALERLEAHVGAMITKVAGASARDLVWYHRPQ